MTVNHLANHVLYQCLVARYRTTTCNDMMYVRYQEQGNPNPAFGSSIGHCMATLHGSEYLEAFAWLQAIPHACWNSRLHVVYRC